METRKLRSLWAAACLLLFSANCTPVFHGTVVDGETGVPIKGAEVRLWNYSNDIVLTFESSVRECEPSDAGGRFTVDHVPMFGVKELEIGMRGYEGALVIERGWRSAGIESPGTIVPTCPPPPLTKGHQNDFVSLDRPFTVRLFRPLPTTGPAGQK